MPRTTTVPANIDKATRMALKQMALDRNTTVGKLVAAAILKAYEVPLSRIKSKMSKKL